MLTCAKGATSVPIAEYVLAVMLAFEKRLPEEWLTEPPPAWNVPQFGPLGGLSGATLGLIGVGAIGTEVAKRALELNASAIILVHNHPSGDPTPSQADIDMTGQIDLACQAIGVALHDHVVVGRGAEVSFRASGLL